VGEIPQMAESAIELLSDPPKLARFRKNARSWAVEHFDSETIIPQYERFYEVVLRAETAASRQTRS
jgi:glycosyltransferase involved in cell wall biosynthesis